MIEEAMAWRRWKGSNGDSRAQMLEGETGAGDGGML